MLLQEWLELLLKNLFLLVRLMMNDPAACDGLLWLVLALLLLLLLSRLLKLLMFI